MLVLPPPARGRAGVLSGGEGAHVRWSRRKFGVTRVVELRRDLSRPTDSSCPGLTRASTPFFRLAKTWMAGTRPAMTMWKGCCPALILQSLASLFTLRLSRRCDPLPPAARSTSPLQGEVGSVPSCAVVIGFVSRLSRLRSVPGRLRALSLKGGGPGRGSIAPRDFRLGFPRGLRHAKQREVSAAARATAPAPARG